MLGVKVVSFDLQGNVFLPLPHSYHCSCLGGRRPIHSPLQPTAPPSHHLPDSSEAPPPLRAQTCQSLGVERRSFIMRLWMTQKPFPEHYWEKNPRVMKSYKISLILMPAHLKVCFLDLHRVKEVQLWEPGFLPDMKSIPSKRQMLWLNWCNYKCEMKFFKSSEKNRSSIFSRVGKAVNW